MNSVRNGAFSIRMSKTLKQGIVRLHGQEDVKQKGKRENKDMKNIKNIKKLTALLLSCIVLCTACGKSGNGTDAAESSGSVVEGELTDIMAQIYAGVNLDAETKTAMQEYVSDTLTAENEQAILGTADISYKEGIYSVPMISSIAYQCVLLRVDPEEADTVKEQLKANADVNKWVCVSAETVLVENVGDLVLFIMSDQESAYAVSASFQALGE